MCDFIYSLWFIYNEYIWWEWEENPEICTNENQEKNNSTIQNSPPTKIVFFFVQLRK